MIVEDTDGCTEVEFTDDPIGATIIKGAEECCTTEGTLGLYYNGLGTYNGDYVYGEA